MGDRYDFELTANLREEVPEHVLQMLSFLLCPGGEAPTQVPDHPFFGPGWMRDPFINWASSCDPHMGDTACSFRRVLRYTRHDVDHYQFTLHLRFAAKAETVFEVGLLFATWVAVWSDQNEFVGYFKGEHAIHPTLLYFHDQELYAREVTERPQRATDGALWD